MGVNIRSGAVDGLRRDGNGFGAIVAGNLLLANSVLLATGVVNNRPRMDDDLHAEALERRLIRYCPICDGYEVTAR